MKFSAEEKYFWRLDRKDKGDSRKYRVRKKLKVCEWRRKRRFKRKEREKPKGGKKGKCLKRAS